MQHPNGDPMLNPIFAGRALTLPSTCSERPAQPNRRPVPPMTGEIISKLGLRYRPTAAADLEAHAESLILLGEDCADIHPALLDEAAHLWARENRWMPRASELRDLANSIRAQRRQAASAIDGRLQAHCNMLNEYGWVRTSGDPYVVAGEPGKQEIIRRSNIRRAA